MRAFLIVSLLLLESMSNYAQQTKKRDIGVVDLTMTKCISPGCWVLVPGSLLKVAPSVVDLWGISGSGGTSVCRKPNDLPWVRMPGSGYEIGAGLEPYMIGLDHHLYKWKGSDWELFTSDVRAEHVSVGIDDELWIIEANTSRAMRWKGGHSLLQAFSRTRSV